MRKLLSLMLATTGLALGVLAQSAQAGSPLTVYMDRSQLLELTSDPGTVIIGNPSIADVSLNGRQLFIHGHAAGETNLIIFDQGGTKLGEYDLSVTQEGSNSLTLFTGSSAGIAQKSYVCAPNCQRSIVVGDADGAFSSVVGQNSTKLSLSQGAAAGAAAAAANNKGGSAPPQ